MDTDKIETRLRRLRRNAQILSSVDLALREAREPYIGSEIYYQPVSRRRLMALAIAYGQTHFLSAGEVHAVLEMSVADALGVTA